LALFNEKLNVIGGLTRHDVRNKLAAIAGHVYVFQKKMGANPEIVEFAEKILRLVGQTERLLNFSKDYEEIGVETPRTINAEECFDTAVKLFPELPQRVLNKLNGLTVTADSMLSKVFYNLIDNSLKHGKKVTTISAHFTVEKDKVKLIYEDDGVGIAETMKTALFESRSEAHGLFLVKKITTLYGWDITEVGELGKGAKFVITIPITPNGLQIN